MYRSGGCGSLRDATRPSEGRGEPDDPEGLVLWNLGALGGLEARAHGHGQNGQRAEGVENLAKHNDPFLSGKSSDLWPYLGLYRAPAASASVASVAAVNNRCFHPESFARIRSPPWNCLQQCRRAARVPTSAEGRQPRWADTGT